MLLVDTSVWIKHFREGLPQLADSLSEGMHPHVSGELACGNMKNRTTVLSDLNTLPRSEVATNSEVLHLIEDRKLWGRCLGWIDVNLLASALLSKCRLWTFDKQLERAARDLGLS
jgi:predicted nucleic acid-binding protein